MKTILASILAAAFLIAVPTARADESAPAGDKAEKAEKGKKEKRDKKKDEKKEEAGGGGW
jgi:ribosomal protein L12E/L44/L45/RPP1/RPP2